MKKRIDAALHWGKSRIADCSDSAGLDAELLLAFCLDKPRSYLYSRPEHPLSAECWQHYQGLVAQRLRPTPVAYLLGNREFYSMEFATTPAALVPRPETEILIELALQLVPPERYCRICDLGTGTGNIAIALKAQRPAAIVYATDVDPDCLALARANADRHDTDITFIESDWYRQLPAELDFDLIVSNPPYIAAQHPFLMQGDLPAEPELALTPGTTGLEALTTIISQAETHLVTGGYLVVEHGYDQQPAVTKLFETHGFVDIHCETDLNDLPRTSMAKRLENPDSGA